MNPKEYIESVVKTESIDLAAISQRLIDPRTIRLLHAAMGLCTEASEFLDHLKKVIFYGKPIDEVNIIEEIGDVSWYQGIALDELEKSFEEVWERNIAKLHARYGISFNEEGAMTRNLSRERYVLEKPKVVDSFNDENLPVHYVIDTKAICDPFLGGGLSTDRVQDITCEMCLRAVKVNYSTETKNGG